MHVTNEPDKRPWIKSELKVILTSKHLIKTQLLFLWSALKSCTSESMYFAKLCFLIKEPISPRIVAVMITVSARFNMYLIILKYVYSWDFTARDFCYLPAMNFDEPLDISMAVTGLSSLKLAWKSKTLGCVAKASNHACTNCCKSASVQWPFGVKSGNTWAQIVKNDKKRNAYNNVFNAKNDDSESGICSFAKGEVCKQPTHCYRKTTDSLASPSINTGAMRTEDINFPVARHFTDTTHNLLDLKCCGLQNLQEHRLKCTWR